MDEDRRYVPDDKELEALHSLREARRLVGMIATGLVLAFTILLAIQHSRSPRDRASSDKKSQGTSIGAKDRPSPSSADRP